MKKILTTLLVGSTLLATSFVALGASGTRATSYRSTTMFKTGEKDAMTDKAKIVLRDKINGSIEAINNRIHYLKTELVSRRTSKFAMTEDELKSMALSIKSDLDKTKEDIGNYMTNGDIYLSDKNNYVQKLDALKLMLKELRVVDPADLEKS
jgi:hypothetical protein